MNFNIGIILFGCGIILISLFILFINGNKESAECNPEYLMELNNLKPPRDLLMEQEIIRGIEDLKNEISHLKKEFKELSSMLETEDHPGDLSLAPSVEWNNFDQSLNYNVFVQKNNDIINAYREGKTMEDIARKLNKSVREVEMVIKLIK